VEANRRILWVAGRIRGAGRSAKTLGNVAAFRSHHLCQRTRLSASSRRCPTLRINSSAGDAARWSHVLDIVFSSRRGHPSDWEHVFPARLWRQRRTFFAGASLPCAHHTRGVQRRPGAHRDRSAITNPVHRRERRYCRSDYVLRAQFPARPARISDAVGLCVVPMDPFASVVSLRLVDFLSAHRRSRTEGRNEFRLIGCASGRRGCGCYRMVAVEKAEAARQRLAASIFPENGCHSRLAIYLARSALPRRDDLRTWFRATGLHRRVRSRRSIMEQTTR
jgi:hypothetical protein